MLPVEVEVEQPEESAGDERAVVLPEERTVLLVEERAVLLMEDGVVLVAQVESVMCERKQA